MWYFPLKCRVVHKAHVPLYVKAVRRGREAEPLHPGNEAGQKQNVLALEAAGAVQWGFRLIIIVHVWAKSIRVR